MNSTLQIENKAPAFAPSDGINPAHILILRAGEKAAALLPAGTGRLSAGPVIRGLQLRRGEAAG